MAYRINGRESFSKGVKRIALDQIDKALENLKPTVRNKDEGIHDTRICIKKIRALLRMVRQSLGKKSFAAEDKDFRNTARSLSKVRDRAALLEIFNKLNTHFSDQLTDDAFAEVKAKLGERKSVRVQDRKAAMAGAAKSLRKSRLRVKRWPETGHHAAFKKGLKRVFQRGRENFQTAYDQPGVQTFHEWRKQVKHLLYETAMLRSLWPKAMKASKKELKHLGELLSDDHDLAMLRKRVVKQIDEFDKAEVETLLALIDQWRNELQITAKPFGARIYAEKPGEFATRLEAYWQAWRAEQEIDPIAAG